MRTRGPDRPYSRPQDYRRSIRRWLEEATGNEWAIGLAWYDTARAQVADLAHEFDLSHTRVAAIVAVLSPMVRWERNLSEARRILARHYHGRAYRKQDGHTAFPANVRKAWDLVEEESTGPYVVKGRKVSAFARLLAFPDHREVVIDSIAILAAVGIDPNPLVTSADAKPYFDRACTLDEIADAYRAIAREQSLRPEQVQAIVWIVWRNERDKD